MSRLPLQGKKIAVLVESQFIPVELSEYRKRFEEDGATVHFLANLYGNSSLTLVSEVEEPGQTPELLTVDLDVRQVKPEDYAAVIMAANYTSVRLRHFIPPSGPDGKPVPITPEMVRSSPAVQFFGRAMRDPRIIKGALCHGLWLLTPTPELLAGRRVICHEVVLADITNAGGLYTPDPSGVVVDEDLVTGRSYHEVSVLIDRIKELIVAGEEQAASLPTPVSPTVPEAPRGQGSKRRILIVLSSYGYWSEELVGPLEVFDAMGYEVEFATPDGRRPRPLPPSLNPDYIDPPLGRSVTTPEMARKGRELVPLRAPRLPAEPLGAAARAAVLQPARAGACARGLPP